LRTVELVEKFSIFTDLLTQTTTETFGKIKEAFFESKLFLISGYT
jgi:hypothetical protein